MKRRQLLRSLGLAAAGAATLPASRLAAQGWGIVSNPPAQVPPPHRFDPRFGQVIQRVVNMPMDGTLQQRAQRLGLHCVNLTWEDTGRFQGSSVGPNISDLTLQVREPLRGGAKRSHLLPVIRYPNFSDRTADVRADKIWVRVGNHLAGPEEQREVYPVPLSEVLQHLGAYLSDPGSLQGSGNLTARRDTHYLVSAQHVFVPLAAQGQAEFNPVLFNYQSSPGNPAVLTLLATRQGTSVTIVDNSTEFRPERAWGQQLFFNNGGQRTLFTAERRTAVQQRIEAGQATVQDQGALEEGADMMMIIQVPLRYRQARRGGIGALGGFGEGAAIDGLAASGGGAPGGARYRSAPRRERSDVETAVIGHGEDEGPFREAAGQRLVRDDRFPIRVTIQFYKATSNGVVDDQNLRDAHAAIERVYDDGDFVGSLVVPTSVSDRVRPTNWRRRRRCWTRHSGPARLTRCIGG